MPESTENPEVSHIAPIRGSCGRLDWLAVEADGNQAGREQWKPLGRRAAGRIGQENKQLAGRGAIRGWMDGQ